MHTLKGVCVWVCAASTVILLHAKHVTFQNQITFLMEDDIVQMTQQ